jgi:hypothetical protein
MLQGPPSTPTEDNEASTPTEHVRNGPYLNRTFTVRRKAAKRTFPWELTADEIQLASPPPHVPRRSLRARLEIDRLGDYVDTLEDLQQSSDVRETKRPRLEEPVPTSIDEAATKTTSHDTTVALPPDADADSDDAEHHHADSDPVMDTQPNARTTGATNRWTPEEDEKLISAVTNTRKKKHSTNWVVVATLVPGRTKKQCRNRWRNALHPSIALTGGSTGIWKDDEDIKLKVAIQKHGDKNWAVIAALVPGRSKVQCWGRWRSALDPSIDRTTGRTGTWKDDEDIKLKDAVRRHGDKNWVAIAALVPNRTRKQCNKRWRTALDPSIALTGGSTGPWTTGEIIRLKGAIQKHGGKNWGAIAALVPGRTKMQCCNRWKKHGP